MIDPGPFLGALAQPFPNRVLEYVIGLRAFLVVIAQAMVKEVPLPSDVMASSEVPFPIRDGSLHARLTWECNDSVQMIWHE
jgi:hypothetical protein